jgi:hypothetical protein
MDKPFVGYDSQYSKNYNRIFRKPLKERIRIFIENLLIRAFINGGKK